MRVIGLFKEFSGASSELFSIHNFVNNNPCRYKNNVIEYLNNGIGVFDIMQATKDPLSETYISGGSSLISDGTWVWCVDLAYYVSKYNLHLPSRFIEHAINSEGISDTNSIIEKGEDIWKLYNNAIQGDMSLIEYF